MRRWVFVLAFALVLYGNGAGVVETFVNYPSWHLIGPAEFPVYHRFIGPRVIGCLVAPAFLGTLFTLLLTRFRPPGLPAWAVWRAVVLQLVSASTRRSRPMSSLGADGIHGGRIADRDRWW